MVGIVFGDSSHEDGSIEIAHMGGETLAGDTESIARTRNNLRSTADQLEAACTEVARLGAHCRTIIEERNSVRQEADESRRDLIAERDSLRQQLEAAQRTIASDNVAFGRHRLVDAERIAARHALDAADTETLVQAAERVVRYVASLIEDKAHMGKVIGDAREALVDGGKFGHESLVDAARRVTGERCVLNPFLSRSCAYGTRSCEVKHERLAAAQRRIAELESEAKEPRGCAVHYGSVHGGEAEELRKGLERLLKEHGVVPPRRTLIALLDRVDARDSLAHLELTDECAALKARVAELEDRQQLDDGRYQTLDLQVEQLTTALRAILPVYRAATAPLDDDRPRVFEIRVANAVSTARAVLAPELVAVLAGLETP
jgi:hypothetical protein